METERIDNRHIELDVKRLPFDEYLLGSLWCYKCRENAPDKESSLNYVPLLYNIKEYNFRCTNGHIIII